MSVHGHVLHAGGECFLVCQVKLEVSQPLLKPEAALQLRGDHFLEGSGVLVH